MKYNWSIKKFNTFSINRYVKYIVKAYTIYDLYKYFFFFKKKNISIIIIGNGSNTIFLRNFNGAVILNRIYNIEINEDNNFWYLKIGSGEIWKKIVYFTIKKNIFGLENLAMIPGRVGAAPIYNIGAYGIEIKDICEYVDILNIKTRKIIRLNNKKCKFKYRSSIFISLLKKDYISIIYLGLKLKKKWKPILNHKKLINKNLENKSSLYIFNYICNLRKKSLPNYRLIGNSGSFFKNPIISKSLLKKKLLINKDIPFYNISKYKVKIFAAWLIDKCNLKGFRIGNVAVSNKNPLVIVNIWNKSNGNDLIFLIKHIYYEVLNKFNIKLELEVCTYNENRKINFLTFFN